LLDWCADDDLDPFCAFGASLDDDLEGEDLIVEAFEMDGLSVPDQVSVFGGVGGVIAKNFLAIPEGPDVGDLGVAEEGQEEQEGQLPFHA
jgi:hypothetical protein